MSTATNTTRNRRRSSASMWCRAYVIGFREDSFGRFDSDADRSDAWCADCNGRVGAAGGEWTPAVLELAQVKVLVREVLRRRQGAKWVNRLSR